MQTIDKTPHQTLTAKAKIMADLAEWFALTAAAETIEAGRTGSNQYDKRTDRADTFSSNARVLMIMSTELDAILEARRAEDQTPSIEKAKR